MYILNGEHHLSQMKLNNIEHIIDRVSERYPYLTKLQIILIVKVFFESIYSILLMGDKISINNLMPNMRIEKFLRTINNKPMKIYKAVLSTPTKMKNK
jgi:hypothetical protein